MLSIIATLAGMEASASKRVRVRAARSFNSHRKGDEFEVSNGPEWEALIENGLLEVVEVVADVPAPVEDDEDAVEADVEPDQEEEEE